MITVIAKFKLKMDKEAEAVAALEEMCAGVESGEPGAKTYMCYRSQKAPDEVVFVEIYEDEEAFQAHRTTPHMDQMNAKFRELFTPPVEVTKLDPVAGFTR